VATLYTLAFDQLTNYLALDTIAASNGIRPICNDNYSLLEHGFLMPLDAPVPIHNSTLILNSIIPVPKDNEGFNCIVVVIKGFNPEYNQNQIDRSLAQIILLNVVSFILEKQDAAIVVDGVTRSSSSSLNKTSNDAFTRFLNQENQMYEELIHHLPDVFRKRVSSMIGMPIERKYPIYVKSRFSVSISAHSTNIISLMAGKPVVDILKRSLLESIVKTSIYYHARNCDPNALAFIGFIENNSEQEIIADILLALSSYLTDPQVFHLKNSIWSHYRRYCTAN
jgi:hypothetical protein